MRRTHPKVNFLKLDDSFFQQFLSVNAVNINNGNKQTPLALFKYHYH